MTEKQQNYFKSLRKLTDLDAKAIRVLYKTGKYSQRDLGAKYGISLRTIQKILEGKTYKGV